MYRWLILATLVALGVTGGALLALPHGTPARVYGVAAIDAALSANPGGWIGRTVLVRGNLTIAPCVFSSYCPTYHLAIVEADQVPSSSSYVDHASAPDMQRVLLLAIEPINPLEERLQGVPFLDALIPSPQPLRWQRPATYNVRLAAVPASQCGSAVCFGAVLVGGAGPFVDG